jgi:hypothetical protein
MVTFVSAGTMISFFALSGVLLPPSLSVMAATKTRSVDFEQYTFELVPGLSQTVRGVDAFVTCPDGSSIVGSLFAFSPNKEGSATLGAWSMLAAPGAAAGDGGSIEEAQIGSKHFKLKGVWDDLFGRETAVICGDAYVPAQVVIQGPCGIGVTVLFKASNGVSGAFKGDAICN